MSRSSVYLETTPRKEIEWNEEEAEGEEEEGIQSSLSFSRRFRILHSTFILKGVILETTLDLDNPSSRLLSYLYYLPSRIPSISTTLYLDYPLSRLPSISNIFYLNYPLF